MYLNDTHVEIVIIIKGISIAHSPTESSIHFTTKANIQKVDLKQTQARQQTDRHVNSHKHKTEKHAHKEVRKKGLKSENTEGNHIMDK